MKFNDAILRGDFKSAKELASDMDMETLRDTLCLLAYDSGSITSYGFVNDLLLEVETSEIHYTASFIMGMALNHLEGAYQIAFHHAYKAAELSPNDMSYQEYLLFFHAIPDKLLRNKEAIKIAKNILEKEPKNETALLVIEETKH
jgi:hypothetical protein